MWAKLKRFFINRWVLTAIALTILGLLVWFAGPAIAFNDYRPLGTVGARVGLIALIVFGIVAWEAFKYWRAWRANRRMLNAISGAEADTAALSQREVAELKQRFDQAMAVLRKARFDDKSGGGRNYLYQLPWYMFIGAPGSGKTTALINSGLRFPLAESLGKDAVKGVGGTRNCDWWFTDEAVLLDTAGRYTTQSSNREVDASSWKGFLALLKRFRPQLPLNGAIVTLSVSDLFVQSPEERAEYARSVRSRIQELYTTLGVRFPIYLVVTKSDLLAGFTEFFNDLGREARAQTWGMTFPYQEKGAGQTAVTQFEQEFDLLVDRLNERMVTRLEEERDTQKRATIFTFAQQFAGVKGLVKGFLDEVFQSSAFAEEAMLRGVYFTSGTQEGTPFDRVLGSISRNYGLERQMMAPAAASGRSYFLTRLLREVVFAESDLGGRSALIEKRRSRMLFAGYASLAVVCLLLIGGWTVSFVRNKALINEVSRSAAELDKQVAALPKPLQGDVLAPFPVLNALRDMPTGFSHRDDDVPLTMGLGLYQGDKLGVPSSQAYLDLLRDAFLPRVALRLESLMRQAPSPEARYEVLKVYLMLYDPEHLDSADVEALVGGDWQRSFPREVQAAEQEALRAHLRTALAQKPLEMTLPIDKTLVEEVRAQLSSASLAQRAYARLKRLGPGEGVPDFQVSHAAGNSGPLVLARRSGTPLTQGIPAMFTITGYDKTFRARAPAMVKQLADEEAWVLGPKFANQGANRAVTALTEVQRLYLTEYIKTWDELLRDLTLKPPADLQGSIQSITLLSAPDSPLKMLLAAIARETKLATTENRSAEATASKAIDKVTTSVKNTVDRLLGESGSSSIPQAMDRPEAQVDRYFEQLHRAVLAAPGTATPLDGALQVLREYELHLRATEDAIKRGVPPPSDSMVIARIKGESDRMPPPLNTLLAGLVTSSAGQAASGAQAGIQKQVVSEVGATCKQLIEGRYPFARSQREVQPADFARVFGPNGTFDGFLKTRMQGLYDPTGQVWRPVKLAENVESFPQNVLTQFQNASVIREAFFPTGGPAPAVTADLVLIKLDDGVSEVQVSVDGQVTRMTAGGGSAIRFNWPSPSPVPSIKLAAQVGDRLEAPPGLSFDGPWALFRLVDAARREGGPAERMVISFNFGAKRAVFELRSPSVRNALQLPEIGKFSCPD